MKNLVLALFVLCLANPAVAKSWMGMTPGTTTRTQVLNNFGKPTKTFSKGGKLSDGLNYQGDEAIKGALETNIYFDKYEVLFRIDVFPAKDISHADILRIYGENFKKMQTKKGHLLLHYSTEGMVVFFDKSGRKVHSFTFMEGRKDEPTPKTKKPRPDDKEDAEESDEEEHSDESGASEEIESKGLLD